MTEIWSLETPEGPGRAFVDAAADPSATLVLGHGAGGGVDARDLTSLAQWLPARGVTVVRFEQPWRTAGGRVATRPPRLDVAWLSLLEQLASTSWWSPVLITGGRSAGARVACRTAEAVGADAVLCLAFPLHLPGRPEKSRIAELAAPHVPRLVFQGSRDTFGSAVDVRAALTPQDAALVTVVELVGADHSFRVPARSSPTASELLAAVVDGTDALVGSLLAAS